MSTAPLSQRLDEWLEADGLGGFASGTVSGLRTRRYHALLLTATVPPSGRVVLVNGMDASIERKRAGGSGREEQGTEYLTRQQYAPGTITDGAAIEAFSYRPWPTWTYRLSDGTQIEHELFVPRGTSAVVLRWRLLGGPGKRCLLRVRPFVSGRTVRT